MFYADLQQMTLTDIFDTHLEIANVRKLLSCENISM